MEFKEIVFAFVVWLASNFIAIIFINIYLRDNDHIIFILATVLFVITLLMVFYIKIRTKMLQSRSTAIETV
jgi:L-asparagine transporter-like permease